MVLFGAWAQADKTLALWLCFQSLQHCRKIRIAFAFGQHLQTVVMVSNIFLVNAQHRKQHIEKIAYNRKTCIHFPEFSENYWQFKFLRILTKH